MPEENDGNCDFPDNDRPLSKEEIEQYLERYDKLAVDFERMESRTTPVMESWLKTLVEPELLTRMRQSSEETIKALCHPDSNRRRAGLYLAINHWRLKDRISEPCEKMALSDPDNEVRNAAIGALGDCYSRTKNARIGHLLATLIQDASLPDNTRRRAYTALMNIHRCEEVPGLSVFSIRSPEDFHWPFVDHYLVHEGTP